MLVSFRNCLLLDHPIWLKVVMTASIVKLNHVLENNYMLFRKTNPRYKIIFYISNENLPKLLLAKLNTYNF